VVYSEKKMGRPFEGLILKKRYIAITIKIFRFVVQFISIVTHSSLILSNQFPAQYNFSLCQQKKYKFFNLRSRHRHGKLFIDRPCKKRADNLLKLSRRQLKMVVAILTGHAPVRGRLYTMGLFDGDPACRFCRKETETVQHIICCCEALARQRYNVFGNSLVEPKDISTAAVNDLCLFIRGKGLNVC
jgi:hypothetical protein